MPKFCRFCGKKLQNPQARFCPACGRELTPSVPPQAKGPEQPRLLIRIPGQSLQETPLDRTAFTIGRKPDNDIVLSLDYVSGHHGRLEQRGMFWHYVDLGSTNGTLVNGRRVQSAAFSPDGTYLASGSGDGTVRLWRVGC